jgi:hypothetical protein
MARSKYRPSGQSDYRMQRVSEGLEGAQAGASIGKAFGPWGALIGGALGGARGAIQGGPSKQEQARDAELNALLRRQQMGTLGLTEEERRRMEAQVIDPLRTQQREFQSRYMGGVGPEQAQAGATAAGLLEFQDQQAAQLRDAEENIARADLEAAQHEENLMRELQSEKQQEMEDDKKAAIKAAAGLATTALSSAEDLAEIRLAKETQKYLEGEGGDEESVGKGLSVFQAALGSDTPIGRAMKALRKEEKATKEVSLPTDEPGQEKAGAEAVKARKQSLVGYGRGRGEEPGQAPTAPGFVDPVDAATRQSLIGADNRAALLEEGAWLSRQRQQPLPGILGAQFNPGIPIPQVTGGLPPNVADLAALGMAPPQTGYIPEEPWTTRAIGKTQPVTMPTQEQLAGMGLPYLPPQEVRAQMAAMGEGNIPVELWNLLRGGY